MGDRDIALIEPRGLLSGHDESVLPLLTNVSRPGRPSLKIGWNAKSQKKGTDWCQSMPRGRRFHLASHVRFVTGLYVLCCSYQPLPDLALRGDVETTPSQPLLNTEIFIKLGTILSPLFFGTLVQIFRATRCSLVRIPSTLVAMTLRICVCPHV
jgi:hypothetical protein